MKNGIFLILAFSCLSLSCSSNGGESKTISSPPISTEEHKGDIKGSWRLADDQVASLIIKPDSIYYTDKQLNCSYQLVNNSMVISDGGGPKDTIGYEMRGNDSLVLTIDNYPEVYLRSTK